MHLVTFIVFFLLSCALSSKARDGSDKEEPYAKTPRIEVTISGKDEQSFSTSVGTPWKGINISTNYNPLVRDISESTANTTYPGEIAHLRYVQKLPQKEIKVASDVVLQSGDSDGITYVPEKDTYQRRDGNRHEFLNASRIFESFAVAELSEGGKQDEANEKSKKTENKLARKEGSWTVGLLENAGVQSNMPELLTNASDSASQEVQLHREQNDAQENKESNDGEIFPTTKRYLAEKSDESATNTITESSTAKPADVAIANQTAESHIDQEENWEPGEDDLAEAANFGLQAMHELYYVQEPKLYSMGLYLGSNEPARYVAAFNDQSEEARNLARFGYAVLQGTAMYLKKFPGAPLELPLSRSTRRTLLEQQCPRRGTPQCPPASLRYRTSDGSCNNLQNLWWGSAMSTMQRFLPAVYQDGVQSIRRSKNGRPLPSAREVTNVIHEDNDVPLISITHMLMQWGQFVDHDLTATGQSRGFNGTVPQCCLPGGVGFQPPEFMHPECLPIAVNLHDSFYGPLGVRCLEFLRSGPAPKESCEFGTREQLSQVTSYLDASMVYSSNALQSDSLRIFRNGLLQYGKIQSRRPFLPKHESDLCKRGSLSTTCFRAGDGRLSEQPALTSLHVVFLRLHNRIATELSAVNSHWSDEKLFQETRRIVGAVVQHITYREFLPIILGPQVMRIFDLEILKKGYYDGYDPTVNPTIANAFSTAAYRFGHSMVQRSFVRFDSDHRPLFNNVSIHDEFSNPANLETAGSVDRLILGLVNQPCQRRDEFITEEMTNHLFQTPGFAFGMDLASLNIQRGRDHGVPPYVQWREPCGLSPIRNFDDLDRVMLPDAARKFRSIYFSVEDIDLFPAGLAEKSVVGGLLGPTFACIIGQQFSNLRRGDRFWYENPESESSFTAGQLQQIRRVTLAQVLCKTMDGIETIQPFVFLAMDSLNNQRLSCDDPAIGQLNLEFWAEQVSEFRRNVNDPQKAKRTATDTGNLPVSRSREEVANPRKRVSNNREQTKSSAEKPFTTSIQQNNKIVVKRPFGRPDNFTVVVQNNAVNSPVFVNDGIFGSQIRIRPVAKPTSGHNQELSNYPVNRPQVRPMPIITIPHSSFQTSRPYVPHAFDDPNNPNPLIYGYRLPDVFYDNFSASSPRPTLYTYYTNFQKHTTQMPDREIDGYLINYGLSHHGHDSFPAYIYEKPKPPINSAHLYESNNEEKYQKPIYGYSQTSTDTRPNSRPNYMSNDYSRPKPMYSTNSHPNNELYHAQKPVHEEPISVANRPNLRPDFRPNYHPYVVQKPVGIENSHLQNENLSNRPAEGYSINSSKPHHQAQSSSNNYQHKPSERPYDYDDPDLYHKRPNVKPQSGLYSSSETNTLTYPKATFVSTSSPAYSQGSVTNHGDYDRYHDVTQLYQKRPLSTQSNRLDVTSYMKRNSTQPPRSDSFGLPSSSFYQKPTNRPIYQKNYQSHLSSYSKEPTNGPFMAMDPHKQDSSYQSPSILADHMSSSISQHYRPTPTYWPETSTSGYQVHKHEEGLSSKPTKVYSVTIVPETINSVHQTGHSGYISQYKVTSEVPKPLVLQTKNSTPAIRKPGQYYYEKNVLHRYPDEEVDQIRKSNHYSTNESEETSVQDRRMPFENITMETSTIENPVTDPRVIQSNESKSTTPTSVISDYDNNKHDVMDDLEGAFSADVESVASTDVLDRMINHWVNPQEDLNLPSTLEMPGILSDEFVNAKELPKPIKSRSHAT